MMLIDERRFEPPGDAIFLAYVLRAAEGRSPVYGAVLETDKVKLERAVKTHRPERTDAGQEVLSYMMQAWREGSHPQPWLYASRDRYIVADDYFWLAMIEQGSPASFPAFVLGEPLKAGLIEKTGPLGPEVVRGAFGRLLAEIEAER
ncbi:MAG: hypothetical protein AAF556_09070 [Pseudomonadota bacterium]